MSRMSFGVARAIAITIAMAFCSYPQTLKIWPGAAPDSETWTQKEKVEKNTPIGTVVINVVTPTLTLYLPERTKATGTGIICHAVPAPARSRCTQGNSNVEFKEHLVSNLR